MTAASWAEKKARHQAEQRTGPVEPHAGSPYRKLRRQVIEEETHCYFCRGVVNKTLPWHPKNPHPGYPSLHLITPRALGGQVIRENSALSHLACNQEYGTGRGTRGRNTTINGTLNEKRWGTGTGRRTSRLRTSRNW